MEPAARALMPSRRPLKTAGRLWSLGASWEALIVWELPGRASELAVRASETAVRASELVGRA